VNAPLTSAAIYSLGHVLRDADWQPSFTHPIRWNGALSIARHAAVPSERVRSVPAMLSTIVMKCLKTAKTGISDAAD